MNTRDLVVFAAVLLAACGSPSAESKRLAELEAEVKQIHTQSTQAMQAARAAQPTAPTRATGTGDEGRWETRALELEGQVARLQVELATAQADAERYRQGLDRAVAELNRMAGRTAAAEATAAAAQSRPAARSGSPARVSTVSTPDIQLLGNLIVVTGRLWNSGDEDAQGSMVLELLIDNRVLDTQTLPLDVPARTDVAYSHTFDVSAPNGTLSARVRLDY